MNIAHNFVVAAEQAEDFETVEHLSEVAFGPGRFARAAFRLREGILHEPTLSFVGRLDGDIIASVRLTKIRIGADDALVLGPLVVTPQYKAHGYGGVLMRKAVEAAKEAGHSAIILVGDKPYYEKFGFQVVPKGQVTLPGPVDPARLLICPLNMKEGHTLTGAALAIKG